MHIALHRSRRLASTVVPRCAGAPVSPPVRAVGSGDDGQQGRARRATALPVLAGLVEQAARDVERDLTGVKPASFRVARGDESLIGTDHVISNLAVHTVVLDAGTTNSHVFDSGTAEQFLTQFDSYGFRATP